MQRFIGTSNDTNISAANVITGRKISFKFRVNNLGHASQMKTNKPRGVAVGARCERVIILKRGLYILT